MAYWSDFILTTASSVEGYKVVKQCGIVFGETFFKHGALSTIGAGISNTIDSFKFGSRELSGSMRLMEEARTHAYTKMVDEAKRRGANAIIAIDSDNTIGGDVMYISLYGTAVKIVSEEDYERQIAIEKKREADARAEHERILAENEERKKKLAEERRRIKEANGEQVEGDETYNDEDLFLSDMGVSQSMDEIWAAWLSYNFDSKYKQIDAYINMRKETELRDGIPANMDQIKEVIAQMIEKQRVQE